MEDRPSQDCKISRHPDVRVDHTVVPALILRLEAAPLQDIARWVEAYRGLWDTSFAQLDAYLQYSEDSTKGKQHDGS
jgi:hypothetical protein